MTQLPQINVAKAYRERETITLRLPKDSLTENDTLLVPANITKRLERNRQQKKGIEIKKAKSNITKQVGGLLSSTCAECGITKARFVKEGSGN